MKRNLFGAAFRRSLNKDIRKIYEADESALEMGLGDDLDAENMSRQEADFTSQLEDEADYIDPNQYNKEEQKLQNHLKQRAQENNELLGQWVEIIDDFTSFVNDPSREDSIKNIIERAMPGSTLEKIKKAEGRRLTRVSTEAAALSQALKSYIGGVNSMKI